jgi:putative ABC transport system permease protein
MLETNMAGTSAIRMGHFLVNITFKVGRRLCSNTLRTGTSFLGIAIAVASLILMVSIGAGAREQVRELVAAEGVNIVYVLSALRSVGGVRTVEGSATTLTVQDAKELKSEIPLLQEICWWRQDPSRVIHDRDNWFSRILSISPGCQSVKGWMPETGRAITQEDFDGSENVAILGQTPVRNIFHGEEPIGSTIRIRNLPFKVIGVLEGKGYAPGGYDQDDIVLVPYKTARVKMLGATKSSVEIIAAATYDREELPQAAELMRELLRFRHHLSREAADDFTIRTQLEVEKFYQGANETLTVFLAVVAMISLLVGGVGIMNLLIGSVVSRTREIGVCLVVGAKRRNILMEFLIEAMMLSLVGGSIGILLGVLGAQLTTLIVGWPTIISGNAIVIAFFFSLVVGLFFGLYPANKAARLNPIEALRYE